MLDYFENIWKQERRRSDEDRFICVPWQHLPVADGHVYLPRAGAPRGKGKRAAHVLPGDEHGGNRQRPVSGSAQRAAPPENSRGPARRHAHVAGGLPRKRPRARHGRREHPQPEAHDRRRSREQNPPPARRERASRRGGRPVVYGRLRNRLPANL